MDAQDLKNSILQLAIQGKLVEQREEEGTAKDLLIGIEVKKQQLVKEGKIKKGKKQSTISEDEVLFEIPDSWEWTRMSNIADMYTGNSIPKSIKENKYSKVEDGYNYIGTKDVGFDYTINYDNGIKIPFEEDKFRNSFQGSILMCIEGGSAGRKIGISEKTVCFGNKLCSFSVIDGDSRFLYYYLQSPLFFQAFRDEMTGIIGGVSITKLKNMVVPLPPVEEQKRVVAKIEELLPYIDKYGASYSEVEELNKKFPENMQKSILQYAIQGKLVEQREEDGTAEDLYYQIQEEKKELILKSKVKKVKTLLSITEDDIPFDIPGSWKWSRLGEVINLLSGQDFPPEKYNDRNKGIPYITGASNISDDSIVINRWTEEPRCIAEIEDILIVCKGSGFGKTVTCNVKKAHIARQIMAIKHTELLNMDYIKYYLRANASIIKQMGQGVIPGIDRKSVQNLLIPLPPLLEQNRIVDKIEEMIPFTKQLTK